MTISNINLGAVSPIIILRLWLLNLFFNRPIKASVAAKPDIWLPSPLRSRVDGADQMLRDWTCDTDRTDGAHGERLRLVGWLLSQADQNDLHQIVEGWNWDHGLCPMEWIALNPATSRATALQLFWRLEPARFVRFVGDEDILPSYYLRAYSLLKEIKFLLEKEFYYGIDANERSKEHEIAYVPPPASHHVDMRKATNQGLYPAAAFKRIKGVELGPFDGAGRCPYDYT